MKLTTKILAGTAGLAAIAAAAPAAAQVYPYGVAQPFGYANPYAYNNYAVNTNVATQQCMAAVQNRLYTRQGVTGVIASMLGIHTNNARVLSITQVTPRSNSVRVRGLASSGRFAGGYGPYGVGAYGALGYAAQPDLSFKCDVDYRGYVRDVDIDRRY